MQRLSTAEFEAIVREGIVLSRNDNGGMTVRCGDGAYFKLFRRPAALSTARLVSASRRFAAAAAELSRRGVSTVEVIEEYVIRDLGQHAVRYRGLDGMLLRQELDPATPDVQCRHFDHLSQFLASLHERGVYFRALHFQNIVVLDVGGFGLIDVAGTRFRRPPLRPALRARNFRHLLRHETDRSLLQEVGIERFLRCYLDAAKLDDSAKRTFLRAASAQHSVLSDAIVSMEGGPR